MGIYMAQKRSGYASQDILCFLVSTASATEPRVVSLLTAVRLEMSVIKSVTPLRRTRL